MPHLESGLAPWRKLYLYSKGDITKLIELSRSDLPSLGLSPDYWPVIKALRSWADSNVPVQVAMMLWRLRSCQEEYGGWRRTPASSVAETGCVYRYIELAALADETPTTDRAMRKAIEWLRRAKLGNGGFPTFMGLGEHEYVGDEEDAEVGTTARVVRILSMVAEKAHDESLSPLISQGLSFLKSAVLETKEGICWPRFKDEKSGVTGASALAVLAFLKLRSADSWLKQSISRSLGMDLAELDDLVNRALPWFIARQNPDGGWGEDQRGKGVQKSLIDVTYYVIRILAEARRQNLASEEIEKALNKAIKWFIGLCKKRTFRRSLYDLAFIVRLAVFLVERGLVKGEDSKELMKVLRSSLKKLLDKIRLTLKPDFDVYCTELIGIAIMEAVRGLGVEIYTDDPEPVLGQDIKDRMRRLSSLPPVFLREKIFKQSENPSELLYILATRRFMGLTDLLVSADIVSSLIGLAVGLLFLFSVSPDLVNYMISRHPLIVDLTLWAIVLASNILWLWVKLFTGRRFEKAFDYAVSLLLTLWYMVQMLKLSLQSLWALRVMLFYTVLVDLVGWLADRAVLSKVLRE